MSTVTKTAPPKPTAIPVTFDGIPADTKTAITGSSVSRTHLA